MFVDGGKENEGIWSLCNKHKKSLTEPALLTSPFPTSEYQLIIKTNMDTQWLKREIKFRMWDKEHKRWLIKGEMEDVGYYEFGSIVPNTLVLQNENSENLLISQFTGLKDKNGVEIFEGDVVEIGGDNERGGVVWSGEDATYIVEFKDYFMQLRNGMNTHKGMFVVGNIYEDPDLIK